MSVWYRSGDTKQTSTMVFSGVSGGCAAGAFGEARVVGIAGAAGGGMMWEMGRLAYFRTNAIALTDHALRQGGLMGERDSCRSSCDQA